MSPRARGRRRSSRRDRGQGEGGRERLLEAAVGLIGERGYAASSVGDICRRAGVARTALYWHFESKEGLLAAVVERVGTTWIEEIRKRAYLAGDPAERVQRLVDEWRRILHEQPQLIRLPMVVALEQAEASERVRLALHRVIHRAESALIEGIEDTLGRSLPDLDLVAHSILTLLQGAALQQIVEPDEERLDRTLAELRRTFLLLIWVRLPEDLRADLPSPA